MVLVIGFGVANVNVEGNFTVECSLLPTYEVLHPIADFGFTPLSGLCLDLILGALAF
ncbi:Uncharacterised protein [Candidatus Bartonella washoeensis]|uniref:Uncharacterized protein n=2 Tax=Candidatus Bartonella washoeensis TaxID=186739 RepID=J1JGA6_9HYPH|nr:hypothetical protein [Bartonella washoeensis]EJF76802.1 hypothetical protein MCQ_01665 [Bartonella washoeensis Sb944nv]EJF83562.1 hypothetical protein MCW_01331 [Bartonella washoeensis 085-0475]SPU27945.1 Uncharacterised protein [Bartonella washoeensis]